MCVCVCVEVEVEGPKYTGQGPAPGRTIRACGDEAPLQARRGRLGAGAPCMVTGTSQGPRAAGEQLAGRAAPGGPPGEKKKDGAYRISRPGRPNLNTQGETTQPTWRRGRRGPLLGHSPTTSLRVRVGSHQRTALGSRGGAPWRESGRRVGLLGRRGRRTAGAGRRKLRHPGVRQWAGAGSPGFASWRPGHAAPAKTKVLAGGGPCSITFIAMCPYVCVMNLTGGQVGSGNRRIKSPTEPRPLHRCSIWDLPPKSEKSKGGIVFSRGVWGEGRRREGRGD